MKKHTTYVRTPDIAANEVMRDYDTSDHKSWRKLAESDKYAPIPHSSLQAIAEGRKVKKWDKHPAIRIKRSTRDRFKLYRDDAHFPHNVEALQNNLSPGHRRRLCEEVLRLERKE